MSDFITLVLTLYLIFMFIAGFDIAFNRKEHPKRPFIFALPIILCIIVVNAYSPPVEVGTMTIAAAMSLSGAILLIWAVINLIRSRSPRSNVLGKVPYGRIGCR